MKVFGQELKQKKMYWKGCHRSRSPAETLQKYIPIMKSLGITRLADVTGLDTIGLPVYNSVMPNSRSLATMNGKGYDRDTAKASALMEAIEFWHAEHIEKPLLHGSYQELQKKMNVVNPNELTCTNHLTYLAKDSPNYWIEGENLLNGYSVWIPFGCVNFSEASSNGLASGNHLLEALVHALCEVIERDAVAFYFLDPTEDKKIRQETIPSGPLHDVLELLHRANILVGISDATFDTGIPTYTCMICDHQDTLLPEGYFWGFGTHLDPEIAALRAVTEAVQCRLTEITGTREDIKAVEYQRARSRDELEEIAHLLNNPPPVVDFGEANNLATNTFEGDLKTILDRLKSIGVPGVYAVDLSRPEFDFAVVKTFIATFEGPYDFGFKPGKRLQAKLSEVDQ